jgi:phage protein D
VGQITSILAESLGMLDPGTPQKGVDLQIGSKDYDIIRRLARETGYDVMIDHTGPEAGSVLLFFAPWEHQHAEIALTYGRTLMEFSPRESDAGQVQSVRANVWEPSQMKPVALTLSWDPKQRVLALKLERGRSRPADPDSEMVIDEPLTTGTAPRRLVAELVPKLNGRSTGTGSAVGDPRIRPGAVLKIEGVGERFGGLYRVTSATHTIDSGGYRTQFEGRKEIWFTASAAAQGAVRVVLPPALGKKIQA